MDRKYQGESGIFLPGNPTGCTTGLWQGRSRGEGILPLRPEGILPLLFRVEGVSPSNRGPDARDTLTPAESIRWVARASSLASSPFLEIRPSMPLNSNDSVVADAPIRGRCPRTPGILRFEPAAWNGKVTRNEPATRTHPAAVWKSCVFLADLFSIMPWAQCVKCRVGFPNAIHRVWGPGSGAEPSLFYTSHPVPAVHAAIRRMGCRTGHARAGVLGRFSAWGP